MRFRFGDLFYGPLVAVLITSNRVAGSTWAWRITRLAHSVPFGLGAAAVGFLAGIVWGFSPTACAAICAAGFYAMAAKDWFVEWRQWRRGY